MLDGFAYTSFKYQTDRELLDRLRRAILALKLEAQAGPGSPGAVPADLDARREDLIRFLDALRVRVRELASTQRLPASRESDTTFTDLADRFIQFRAVDVDSRLAELERVRGRVAGSIELRKYDFRVLDRLQGLLEEEAAESVRGLYGL